MSDTDTDPILQALRERKAELQAIAHETMVRLSEVENFLQSLSDGRTRVRRRLREVPTPPDSAPEQVA